MEPFCKHNIYVSTTDLINHSYYQFIVMNLLVADHTDFYCIFTVFDQKGTVTYCKFGW